MTKKLFLPVSIATIAAAFVACNSSDSIDYTTESSSSAIVSAFSLVNNSNVLDSLENVFFTINLEQAQIYNADSLPYGTNVSKLVPSITTATYASAVTLEFPRPGMTDSISDYLTNSTDSIDFSNGPVKLRVISQSGTVERVYQVRVNVHQVKPDTLAWNRIESAPLPSAFDVIDGQATIKLNDKYYCLTSSNAKYSIAYTSHPGDSEWTSAEFALAMDPNIESLRSTGTTAYMLNKDGQLYSSTDMTTWTSCSLDCHYIYGAYEQDVLVSKKIGDEWFVCAYPSGKQWQMPDGFPIENATIPVSYLTDMAYAPQMLIVGGRDADGQLSNKTWGFDGENFANITRRDIDVALEFASIVAYDLFDVPSSTWTPVKYPALVLLGGRGDDGINREVYMSTDWGMTWKLAPDLMQLPDALPAFYGESTHVISTTMYYSRYSTEWTPIRIKALPPQCQWIYPVKAGSRVTSAPTEWECPAIYLFGGKDAAGNVQNTIWRGYILRYTFPPVY